MGALALEPSVLVFALEVEKTEALGPVVDSVADTPDLLPLAPLGALPELD